MPFFPPPHMSVSLQPFLPDLLDICPSSLLLTCPYHFRIFYIIFLAIPATDNMSIVMVMSSTFCRQVLELDKNGTAGGSTSTELLRRQLGSATEKVQDLEVVAERKQQVTTRAESLLVSVTAVVFRFIYTFSCLVLFLFITCS